MRHIDGGARGMAAAAGALALLFVFGGLGGCAAELRAIQAESLFSTGCAAQREGHADDAARAYRASLALAPGSAAANNLGVLAAEHGDIDGAAGWFEQAVALNGDDLIARVNLGVVL